MAWTTPPTFVDGAVLSAAQLNILSDDLEYLAGYVAGGNPAVTSTVCLVSDGGPTPRNDVFHLLRHLHRYLHVRVVADDEVEVHYGGTKVFEDGSPDGDETYVVDLESFGLVVGMVYTVRVHLRGSTPRIVYYLIESDLDTL